MNPFTKSVHGKRRLVRNDGNTFSEREFDRMKTLIEKFCDFGGCPYQNKMGCECPVMLSFDEVARLMAPDAWIKEGR